MNIQKTTAIHLSFGLAIVEQSPLTRQQKPNVANEWSGNSKAKGRQKYQEKDSPLKKTYGKLSAHTGGSAKMPKYLIPERNQSHGAINSTVQSTPFSTLRIFSLWEGVV